MHEACTLAEFYVSLFIFADQVFIDPTFSGIFVCGPLQSFVVNVCIFFDPFVSVSLVFCIKRCFPKYGFFSFKMSAQAKKKIDTPSL